MIANLPPETGKTVLDLIAEINKSPASCIGLLLSHDLG